MKLNIPRVAGKNWIFTGVMIALCIGLCFIPSVEPLALQMTSSANAKVTAVDNGSLQVHGLLQYGSQYLTVEILDGEFAGKSFPAPYYGKY